MIFSSKFACRTRRDLSNLPLALTPSMKCHYCNPLPSLPHRGSATNVAIRMTPLRIKNAASCCQAWRDGLAPLSAKGGTSTLGAATSNVGLIDDNASCHDKNGAPNNTSPCRGGSPTKSRGT